MLLFGALSWWRGHEMAPIVLWAIGACLTVAGLAIPGRLGPVHGMWMQFAEALSKITTPILMSLVYFLVVLPTGVLMRRFGRNPLVRPASGTSYWITRTSRRERPADMRRQF